MTSSDLGGSGLGGADVNHLFDRGRTPATPKEPQHYVEEAWKECGTLDSAEVIPFPLSRKPACFDEVQPDLR